MDLRSICLLLPAALALSPPAQAQGNTERTLLPGRTKLERACGDALPRFCPELEGQVGQTFNQATCLKPYRSSLSLTCRHAVSDAIK